MSSSPVSLRGSVPNIASLLDACPRQKKSSWSTFGNNPFPASFSRRRTTVGRRGWKKEQNGEGESKWMSERISTWKLEGEGSSGRHLTGKRHSRRIQPRSLLSLLLSASRPLSPRPRPRPPRKGCALFPSTRSASVSQKRPFARTPSRTREVTSLWKIPTFLCDVATLPNANYKNHSLIRQEPRAQMSRFEEEIARFAKAIDCDISRLHYGKRRKNGRGPAKLYIVDAIA